MHTDPPVIDKSASLCKVARLLRLKSHVWVVEEKEAGVRILRGVVTEKDFLELLNPLPDRMYTTGVFRPKSLIHGNMSTVQEFMTSPVVTCSPETTIAEALATFWDKKIRHLAVASGERLVGELSMKGIIAAYYAKSCDMLSGSE